MLSALTWTVLHDNILPNGTLRSKAPRPLNSGVRGSAARPLGAERGARPFSTEARLKDAWLGAWRRRATTTGGRHAPCGAAPVCPPACAAGAAARCKTDDDGAATTPHGENVARAGGPAMRVAQPRGGDSEGTTRGRSSPAPHKAQHATTNLGNDSGAGPGPSCTARCAHAAVQRIEPRGRCSSGGGGPIRGAAGAAGARMWCGGAAAKMWGPRYGVAGGESFGGRNTV
jgi:hypothetical protein